ncbi:AbiV family abortive infection protein [Leeuwenhoekiella sp. A16]|uniref:AbiV family abortive infection protein n=1 Tax=Leeuwenhoekiella sp. A16 TaxID=3141462 RepID=UPI003A808F76
MEVQQFINLSTQSSKGLDKSIFQNAKKLKADSLLIAEKNKSYSTATSLLILSSEEAIKAILVRLHSEGFKVYQIKGAKKFFSDHRVRHEVAQLIVMGSGLMEASSIWYERKEKPLIKNAFINGFLNLLATSVPVLNTFSRIYNLEEFNDLKNQGFYVDYKNELLIPSEKIQESNFNTAKGIAVRLFKFYKLLTLLYNHGGNNRISKSEQAKLKESLKLLIDQAIVKDGAYELNKR